MRKKNQDPSKNRKIYLDYAATTLVDPRVITAMLPYFSERFGNTMSLHGIGQEAKQALEESREAIAETMGAKAKEIIFTSSATESNNLVLKGIAWANKDRGNHIIISSIEHACVMESARWLEKQGFEITRMPVDRYGFVSPEKIKRAIKKNTILVSIIHASNEIGTIQPISKIGEICRERRIYFERSEKQGSQRGPYFERSEKQGSRRGPYFERSEKQGSQRGPYFERSEKQGSQRGPYFHTDASQSFGKIPVDVKRMKVDLLTASSHKMYGPKGVGLLFIKEGTRITPLLSGGGQESGIRSSTVNVAGIVGFAEACRICQKEMRQEGRRLIGLRDKMIKGILKIKGSHLNGHPTKRIPNNINVWFEFVEGESIVIQLDMFGIAASTGSACSSIKLEPSHVLLAIGLKHEQAHGSLRLTLGRWTTEKEINFVLKVLPRIIENLRKISPFKKSFKF